MGFTREQDARRGVTVVPQRMVRQKLRGHFAYYGITGNFRSLAWFRFEVVRCWRKWLNRRNRERSLDWDIFNRLLRRHPLPPARGVPSVYPRAASPCSEDPYASKMTVRGCGR